MYLKRKLEMRFQIFYIKIGRNTIAKTLLTQFEYLVEILFRIDILKGRKLNDYEIPTISKHRDVTVKAKENTVNINQIKPDDYNT
jgi:hypothetical protein